MIHRVTVIGNSHIRALEKAVEDGIVGLGGIETRFLWLKTKNHGSVSKEDAIKACCSLGAGDLLVLSHLGALHNQLALFEHDAPFSVADPETGVPTPANRTVVPVAAVREFFLTRIGPASTLKQFASGASCPVFHFGSPPPRRQMLRKIKKVRLDRGEVDLRAFADPALRLAVWRIETEVVDAHLEALGIRTLPAPPEARDEDGYLHPDFYAEDATHANAAYGALVIMQIISALDLSGSPEGGAA
ncbi:hypothetical protein ABGN05_29390 [Aquibium sp. LZ166]|uniref:SGNH/GDSL hydrolase family protein n=1 Tax=Aquibium pacificus TaxID=3153579 RepID=A0ABV3SSG4_9HYPH